MGIQVQNIKINRYPEYKNSGVEWLGEIPSHWKQLSNKYIFKIEKTQVGKKSGNFTLLSLTLNGVIKRDMENPQGKFPAEFDTYQEVKSGDFIFCLFDVEETPRTVGLSDYDGMITGAYTVMRPGKEFSKRYLYYFYLNIDSDKRMRSLYKGLRNTIPKEVFLNFKTHVPPINEQTAIARFLDTKTALIDKAIAIKEKQIELLKERRQILIHRAVTRGLNPNVKMKDSGVEWIGEVPEHWKTIHLRRLFSFQNTKRIPLSAEEREKMQGEYPYYGASGIIDYVNNFIFDEPLILIAEDGANLLSKSTPLAFVAEGKYWVNNHAHILKPLLPGFLYWSELLSEVDYTTSISGAAQPKLTKDRLGSIQLPVPTEKEIDEISNYIEIISSKIGRSSQILEQEIEKLFELKACLINSTVIGKVKVNSNA